MTTREDADLALRDKARNATMKVSVVIPVSTSSMFQSGAGFVPRIRTRPVRRSTERSLLSEQ